MNTITKVKNIRKLDIDFEKKFLIVDVENIELKDSFLLHKPISANQKRVMKHIIEAKEEEMNNFRINAIDPSFSSEGSIIFLPGVKPAVERSSIFWDKVAKDFIPEKNSRLPDIKEYDVFLAYLIKTLVEKRHYFVREAWKVVCDESQNIAHYCDSKGTKYQKELTGSRLVYKFYDLANICKIIKDYKTGKYWNASGNFTNDGCDAPLADIQRLFDPNFPCSHCTGKIIIDV